MTQCDAGRGRVLCGVLWCGEAVGRSWTRCPMHLVLGQEGVPTAADEHVFLAGQHAADGPAELLSGNRHGRRQENGAASKAKEAVGWGVGEGYRDEGRVRNGFR